MLVATDIRVGNILRFENKVCKVLTQELKGTGKFGKTVHLKVRCIEDGHIMEKSLRAEEKVDEVEFHRSKVQYLYKDGNQYVFMSMENYEQFQISESALGQQSVFLKENDELEADFIEGNPAGVDFPEVVELKVMNAPPAVKGGSDSTYKEIELENGLKVLAPQFVKEGESVRINTHDLSYHARVTKKSL